MCETDSWQLSSIFSVTDKEVMRNSKHFVHVNIITEILIFRRIPLYLVQFWIWRRNFKNWKTSRKCEKTGCNKCERIYVIPIELNKIKSKSACISVFLRNRTGSTRWPKATFCKIRKTSLFPYSNKTHHFSQVQMRAKSTARKDQKAGPWYHVRSSRANCWFSNSKWKTPSTDHESFWENASSWSHRASFSSAQPSSHKAFFIEHFEARPEPRARFFISFCCAISSYLCYPFFSHDRPLYSDFFFSLFVNWILIQRNKRLVISLFYLKHRAFHRTSRFWHAHAPQAYHQQIIIFLWKGRSFPSASTVSPRCSTCVSHMSESRCRF